MKKLLVFLLVFSTQSAMAQDFIKIIDSVNNEPMLVGCFQFAAIQTEPSFTWFADNAKTYTPSRKELAYLKQHLPQYNIVVVMGTWCSDSHLLVPQLYALCNATNFPKSQIAIIGVNRSKQALHNEGMAYHIERVPTIIVYKNEVELGRIIESTQQSLEADLVAIIKQ